MRYRKRNTGRCGLLALCALLAACTLTPSAQQRTLQARQLAAKAGMQSFGSATALPLRGFVRLQRQHARLAVYIEGDGHAWLNARTPSPDPTPVNPVALQLAVGDTAANVAYLARPGQYGVDNIDNRYWLAARFSPDVVAASHDAVVALAQSADAVGIDLVGYSGGAAIATLVAARLHAEGRADLTLSTVAGNLDIVAWTDLRHLSPLRDSLNPADVAAQLQDVPQRHLVGSRDRQVPPAVLDAFLARMGQRRCVTVVTVDADHAGPWGDSWQQALQTPPVCRE